MKKQWKFGRAEHKKTTSCVIKTSIKTSEWLGQADCLPACVILTYTSKITCEDLMILQDHTTNTNTTLVNLPFKYLNYKFE